MTTSSGVLTFQNLTEGCWDINASKENYVSVLENECVINGHIKTKTVYLTDMTSVGNMTPSDMARYVNSSIDDLYKWLEFYRTTQPQTIYENVTEYKPMPYSPESFAKLLEGCDPTFYDVCQSENDLLKKTNIEISENRIIPLEKDLKNCKSELNETITFYNQKYKWRVPIWIPIGISIGFIGINFFIFYKKKEEESFTL